jgi:hypothetical protein
LNLEDNNNFYCFSTGLIADGKERVWMKSLIHTYDGTDQLFWQNLNMLVTAKTTQVWPW